MIDHLKRMHRKEVSELNEEEIEDEDNDNLPSTSSPKKKFRQTVLQLRQPSDFYKNNNHKKMMHDIRYHVRKLLLRKLFLGFLKKRPLN
ncbi:uncharacterized protein LOC120356900 isoform X3 [Solenopsis invicta]|nr:uncharacterized protein LOC120356900 isoform X3 [Solenopsis invicta]